LPSPASSGTSPAIARKWNVFHGTTEAGMNAQMSEDKVWERQTKSCSDPEARAWARLCIEDPHQVLGVNATKNPGKQQGGGCSQEEQLQQVVWA
jgi:hypothetical protein